MLLKLTNSHNVSAFQRTLKYFKTWLLQNGGKKDTLLRLAFKEIRKTILTSMDNNSNICSPRNHKCPVTDNDSLTDKMSKRHLAFNGFCTFFPL